MYELNSLLIINNLTSIPLYFILRYINPIIALKFFLNDNDTIEKKMLTIIKFLQMCENNDFMNNPYFFITLGIDFFEYRIYMKPFYNIISGLDFSQKTLEYASINKNIYLLEWMHIFYCKNNNKLYGEYILDSDTIDYDCIWSSTVFENAIINCDILTIRWLNDKIYSNYNDDIIYYAVKHDNLQLVEWLILEEFTMNEKTLIPAIENGNLKMLKLLIKYGCPYYPEINNIVINCGRLEIIKYIYYKYQGLFENNKLLLNNLNIKNDKEKIIEWLNYKNLLIL